MNLALSHIGEHGKNTVWVRKLIAAGWELDSHTLTHPNLTLLGNADLRHEVAGSRRKLQRLFGVPVRFFSYPSGAFDPRVIAAVRAAGYLGAVSTIDGLAVRSEGFALRRVRIDGSDDLHDFARKLNTS
jgi:peptidoglycan/xylan/chitin deacetylase (PgdA/CDA1 family)